MQKNDLEKTVVKITQCISGGFVVGIVQLQLG